MNILRVGLLTIGQSPRVDVTRDFLKVLSGKVEVVERGALDGMSIREVEKKLKPEPNHTVYTSRMRDGSQVVMSKEKLIPLLQEKIRELESENVDVITILCSGEFPKFKSETPIIYPEKLLKAYAEGLQVKGKVGVLIPLPQQVEYATTKWSKYYSELIVEPISPYSSREEEFYKVGEKFSNLNVKIVIMDCIGYTLKHKEILKKYTNKPVITTRSVIIKALEELAE